MTVKTVRVIHCNPISLLLAALLLCATGVAAEKSLAASREHAGWQAAVESISAKQLAKHVERLCDERLEGRAAGTRGAKAAADYVAGQFGQLKLRPASAQGDYFQPFPPNFRNVIAAADGDDPQLNRQCIVLGAHYDHIGYGDRRSSRGPVGFVHPGADDNASGVAALLELAEAWQLLSRPARRTVLFVAFDAEEIGLLGAKHLAAHLPENCQQPAAMINLDMIGRLREEKFTVYGTRTGYGWRRFIAQRNSDTRLRIDFSWNLTDDADHYPFFVRRVPVLMFHTGLHDEYHTPSDRPEKLDYEGMERIARLVFAILYDLAHTEELPRFRGAAASENEHSRRQLEQRPSVRHSRLGVHCNDSGASPGGVVLTQVISGSAAEKAGLRSGDQIIRFAGREINSSQDLIGAVQTASNRTTAIVLRRGEDKPTSIEIELDGHPLRLGITWRTDDAEPGTVVLVDVVPGTPGAAAGLKPSDRIYAVNRHGVANDELLMQAAAQWPEPVALLVEREGRLSTVVLRPIGTSGQHSGKRAAWESPTGLPLGLALELPLRLPWQLRSELPAQLPAEWPVQLLAEWPVQLPVALPGGSPVESSR